MNELKPGRELDALIAEEVMGWHEYKDANPKAPLNNQGDLNDHPCETCGSVYGHGIKPYSTDISAAWEVAQKIKDMDDETKFIIHLSQTKHNECEVEITYWIEENGDRYMGGPFFVLGDTAPHAICLAALSARSIIQIAHR